MRLNGGVQAAHKDAEALPNSPLKPLRANPYVVDGKSIVALVRSDDRKKGINHALPLI